MPSDGYRGWVGVLGGLWLLAAPFAVAAPARPTDESVHLLRPLHQTHLRVRWEAVVHDEGGQFLLWRGADPNSLGVVARVSPQEGGRYEFVDPVPELGNRVYQLSFRDRHGREHVLATRQVRLELLTDRTSLDWTGGWFQPPLEGTGLGEPAAPARGPVAVDGPLAPDPGRLIEPPTPPPRGTVRA